MKTYLYIISALILSSCLESNNVESEHGHGHGHGGHGEHEKTSKVSLTNEQLSIMEIETSKPLKKYIANTIKASGTLEIPPQNKSNLSAIAEGRVKSILVTEGQAVKKGQTLATIENIEFIDLQKDYLKAVSKKTSLVKDYNRKKKLFEDSIVSELVLEEVEELVQLNEIEIKTTKAKLQLLGISISSLENNKISTSIPVKSPIDGFVRLISININQYLQLGNVLFEIVDNEHVHLDLLVFEKDAPFVRNEQKVTFSIGSMPNKIYEASIFAVGKAFETESKALKVHAELDKEYASLLPGLFIDATIYANNFTALTLPNESFIEEDGTFYVFVKKEDGNFIKTEIRQGKHFGDYTEIVLSNTITENTVVATTGAYYLNSEMNKESFEHSH